MVFLVLLLAAMNIGFSLVDPIIFGKLINLATHHQKIDAFNWDDYLFIKTTVVEKATIETKEKSVTLYGVVWLLLASITVAMISRIAKNFQDYFLNVIV